MANATNVKIGTSTQSTTNGAGIPVSIMMQSGHVSYGAKHCADLASGGYDDWYLPSIDEWPLIWTNRIVISNSSTANGGDGWFPSQYMTSTEIDASTFWAHNPSIGSNTPFAVDKSTPSRLRPVRAF